MNICIIKQKILTYMNLLYQFKQKQMSSQDFLNQYLQKLIQKVKKFQQQWKGTRFAAIDQSSVDPEDQDQNQYQQVLEKYRGKRGDIKPLGLILYNKYLTNLFILFLVLTLLFVPVAIVYSFGDGLSHFQTSSFSKSILLFGVANLPSYRLDDLQQDQFNEISFHRYLTIITDVIAICVVFSFLIYLKIYLTKITYDYKAKCPQPHLYCLEVQNIEGFSEQKILEHFSKMGKVAQVSGVYTHHNTIYDLSKIVKLASYLCYIKPGQNQYDETVENIRKKYFQLAQNYFKAPKPQLKSAFICFQQIIDRNRVYDLYKYQINPLELDMEIEQKNVKISKSQFDRKQSNQAFHETNIMFQNYESPDHQVKINKSKNKQQNHPQKLKTMRPKVKKCRFQPLTLNWQNCDIDRKSQKIKFFCQFVLLIIVAFVILLGLFLLNINSTHIKQQQVPNILNHERRIQKRIINDKRQRYTFCASLKFSQIKWENYDNCAEYFQFQRNKFVLMLSFSLMVAVINLLTNRILWELVAFRRYRTLAERNHFLITSIFFFSFINSAILTLLIRGQNTGVILRAIVGKLLNFPQDAMQVTVFAQFNRQWYMMIGSQLTMNYIVSLIIFPHFHILLHLIRTKIRDIRQKRTQKRLRKPVFNYCSFYALSLKSLFFALLYSNSMPVFYLLCCIAVAVQIILGKILLHYFVEQPVFVDNNAIQVVMNTIPYALLLHCFTSIIFLNVEQIFPTQSSYENIHNSWAQINLLKFQRGFVYVIFMLLIGIYIWNRPRIDKMILKYWFGRTQSKVECDQTLKFKQIKMNPAFLASYKMKDNPKYKILYYALQLFCSHMEKLRKRGGIKSFQSHQSLDVSSIFTQQASNKKGQAKDSILRSISSPKDTHVNTLSQTSSFNKTQVYNYENGEHNENENPDVGLYKNYVLDENTHKQVRQQMSNESGIARSEVWTQQEQLDYKLYQTGRKQEAKYRKNSELQMIARSQRKSIQSMPKT